MPVDENGMDASGKDAPIAGIRMRYARSSCGHARIRCAVRHHGHACPLIRCLLAHGLAEATDGDPFLSFAISVAASVRGVLACGQLHGGGQNATCPVGSVSHQIRGRNQSAGSQTAWRPATHSSKRAKERARVPHCFRRFSCWTMRHPSCARNRCCIPSTWSARLPTRCID